MHTYIIFFCLVAHCISAFAQRCDSNGQCCAKTSTNSAVNLLLQSKSVASIPQSGIEEKDGIIRVSVYIVPEIENIHGKKVDGTAIIRTRAYLIRKFPELGKHYNVCMRVIRRGFDDEDRVYSFVTEYQRKDIEDAIRREKNRVEEAQKEAERKRAEEEARILAEEEALVKAEEEAMAKAEAEEKRIENERAEKMRRALEEKRKKDVLRAKIEHEVEQNRKSEMAALKSSVEDAERDNELDDNMSNDSVGGLTSGENEEGTLEDVNVEGVFN